MEPHLSLKGQIDRDIAALFIEQLSGFSREDAPLVLDLEEAELDDAAVVAVLVDHLRQAARRVGAIQVLRPPQVLAHGLYRVGALAGSTLQLIEPREELGASG